MMAEAAPSRGSGGISFSEMTELPPLKEDYITTPPPRPAAQQQPSPAPNFRSGGEPEKPKIQPREVAEKAIKEIKNVPPSLMVYSIAGAAVLILIIAVALVLHINHLNSDDGSPRPAPPEPTAQSAANQPAAPVQLAQSSRSTICRPRTNAGRADVAETQPEHVPVCRESEEEEMRKTTIAPVGSLSPDRCRLTPLLKARRCNSTEKLTPRGSLPLHYRESVPVRTRLR